MDRLDQDIRRFMQRRIHTLNPSKAALARLRRGIGKNIGEMPELLGFVLPEEELSSFPLQEAQIEKALYTALTLYALHQQGCANCVSTNMTEGDSSVSHKNSFGHAVRKLWNITNNQNGVSRRFDQVLTAKDLQELSTHARGLINLMKQQGVSIDYPSFAVDLYWFQQLDYRKDVILSWGKDFYMQRKEDDEE
ncbi:type I-E CRISPR-associated protein Cse2/CasB [uncultured Mitsuokella sp.]|uniref:type I-E CRISPR-associated protein Cse2/CasB n=1 Tax=uncultured Mitsuokella sp. TaxID=453120 RepID=UPI0025E8F492|nr:type I-E CRISPR-associated protein Cse2/CasB [uncultured Mitsuokella sp.]